MKKRNFITGLFVLSSIMAFAKQVKVEDAQKIGFNFLVKHGISSLSNPNELKLVITQFVNLYAFSGDKCFVLISADDVAIPVLGYSTDQIFEAQNIPSNIEGVLSNYNKQIAYLLANNLTSAGAATEWHNLKNNVFSAAKTTKTTSVSPLVPTNWNQAPLYNDLCPYDASAVNCNYHSPTGCVATAMAQIMYYWKWPGHGTGSNSYYSDYGMLSADFGATNYIWSAMSPNAAGPYVDTLMYDAGVSVNMGYGTNESGAYVVGGGSSSQAALPNNFCYNASTIGSIDRSVSDAVFISTIEAEMDASRPVIYTGFGAVGGHAWVVDGYDASDYFHCNFGWGGSDNGFYYMDIMVPGPTSNGTFNDGQVVLIGITPDAPDVSFTAAAYLICQGNTTSLTATVAGGVYSSNNPSIATVSSTGIVTGVSAGTVTITYGTTNSCGFRYNTRNIIVVDPTLPVIEKVAGLTHLSQQAGLIADNAGNLIYASKDSAKIYKYNLSTGAITTVAGNGVAGFSGDGGPAINAQLSGPVGVALDATGNLYIADLLNHRVRIVSPTGIINTVAGNGTSGYNGDGIQATAAQLTNPGYVALDSHNNLYISDMNNQRIRQVNLASGIISTFAGNGTSGYNGDGISASTAQINYPGDIKIDRNGNLVIADYYNNRIRSVSPAGVITSICTGLTDYPQYLAQDTSGNFMVVGASGLYIKHVSTAGAVTSFAGAGSGAIGDGGAATAAFFKARGLTVDNSDNVYILDRNSNEIRKVSIPSSGFCSGTTATASVIEETNKFKLYPNPSSGTFSLIVPESTYTVNVFDCFGRLVTTKVIDGGNANQKMDMDLGHIANGTYLVRVVAKGNVYLEKLEVR